MSANLEMLLKKLEELTAEELLLLLDGLGKQLRQKTWGNGNGHKKETSPDSREVILAQYFLPQPAPEEIEARLAKMFTPEELTRIDKTNFKNLPIGSKSVSQMIIEDREDRL